MVDYQLFSSLLLQQAAAGCRAAAGLLQAAVGFRALAGLLWAAAGCEAAAQLRQGCSRSAAGLLQGRCRAAVCGWAAWWLLDCLAGCCPGIWLLLAGCLPSCWLAAGKGEDPGS